jgi:hypothetical protein
LFYANYVKTLFEQIDCSSKIKTSDHTVDFEIIPNKKDASGF